MKRLVVIDTETGGLDSNEHSLLTLGAALLVDGEITSTFHIHVLEEDLKVDPQALSVNGITEAEIKAGMSPSFVVTAFEQWLRNNNAGGRMTLAGHNIAGFDMGFMKRLYKLARYRMPFDYHVLDTMSVALVLKFMGKLNVPNVKLDTLCRHFGIKIRENDETGRHNSQEDAVATAKLLVELMHLIECDGCAESCQASAGE